MLTSISARRLGAEIIPATMLKAGDVILRGVRIVGEQDGVCVQEFVRVRVLQDMESVTETYGPLKGTPVNRFWCQREDTGAQGYMTFGVDGIAARMPKEG